MTFNISKVNYEYDYTVKQNYPWNKYILCISSEPLIDSRPHDSCVLIARTDLYWHNLYLNLLYVLCVKFSMDF